MLYRQVAVINVYLASPLYALCVELGSGLNLLTKYVFFLFSIYNTVRVHLIKRKYKVFRTVVRVNLQDHSEVFISNALVYAEWFVFLSYWFLLYNTFHTMDSK